MINNKLFRGFTFDGVNSLDYDIYITGEGVYNAPERAVEKVSVPGRNGDLTIDQGRFENIDVTYAQCGCAAKTQAELAEKVAAFRNALCSRVGYKRLTDDYNKDEYRMAMYASGLEVEAVAQHRMGTFDIVFDAMPQRFLLSGELPKVMAQNMVPSSTKTETGSIVSVESDGGDAVTSLVAQIEPVQAGSGNPSPTNVRPITGWTSADVNVAGKNLITVTARTQTTNGVTFTFNDDGSVLVFAPSAVSSGGAELNFKYSTGVRYLPVGVPLTVSGGKGKVEARACYNNGSGAKVAGTSDGSDVTFTIPDNAGTTWARVRVQSGFQGEELIYPMVRLASDTDATWKPIKGNTYPISFGSAGTVYGGTVDVVTGLLTVTRGYRLFTGADSEGWAASGSGRFYCTLTGSYKDGYTRIECISNRGKFSGGSTVGTVFVSNSSLYYYPPSSVTDLASFKSWLASNNLQVVYELATPQTYNLTAQQVELLTGGNTVWADTGDITLTYGDDPYKVVNPTLFESKPLLKVTGRGTLSVGDVTMTISGTTSQVLYIDCDIMEVYSITDGQMQPQNSLVTISGNEYPALRPGATQITLGPGITQVVITPRWWRI